MCELPPAGLLQTWGAIFNGWVQSSLWEWTLSPLHTQKLTLFLIIVVWVRTQYEVEILAILLFTRSKGHGSGCTTALSGMHRYLYRVCCLTPPTSLCSANTQNLHSSTVVRISRQCPHPRPKANVLATHPTLWSWPIGREATHPI